MSISKLRVAKAIYDFAVDGTASGDITLAQTESIPAGAIILRVTTNETDTIAGSTDIDLQVGSVKIAETINFTGDAGVISRTVVPVELATAGDIMIHNDGSAISDGAIEIFVEYAIA